MLGKEYQTIVCMEGPVFYTLYGVARIGKDCNKISGDNFMMRELGGGKLAVALSDGMGSGEKACRESTLVMELLEEAQLHVGQNVNSKMVFFDVALRMIVLLIR